MRSRSCRSIEAARRGLVERVSRTGVETGSGPSSSRPIALMYEPIPPYGHSDWGTQYISEEFQKVW